MDISRRNDVICIVLCIVIVVGTLAAQAYIVYKQKQWQNAETVLIVEKRVKIHNEQMVVSYKRLQEVMLHIAMSTCTLQKYDRETAMKIEQKRKEYANSTKSKKCIR